MDHRQSGEEDQILDNGGKRDQGGVALMRPPDAQTQMVAAPGNFQFTFEFGQRSNHGSYIEPETSPDDVDSSESLSESVQTYPEEYGRTYHAYRAGFTAYAFPNDPPERERLSLQHATMTRLFEGKLYFAPLNEGFPPRRILDIATGLGDWAIEIGDRFPNSQVTATDLSPIQPAEVPPNVTFFVEDSSEEWEYTIPFDYIHTRVTAGCWSSFRDQIAVQAFEALNPGGFFESQEFDGLFSSDDGTLAPDSALARWSHDMCAASETLNRPLVMARYLKNVYEEVGFVDVQERIFKVPTNAWPKDPKLKELGRMWESNMTQGLSGFSSYLFNKVYERSPAEIEVSLVDVRREFANPRIHAYMSIYVVWGRKPYPGEDTSKKAS
ncbi:S-adenosyl-L-methionine-dependent methyltransferase [Sarocladium strictum]